MTLMMSTIFLLDSLIADIVVTTSDTTCPPLRATSDAPTASWLAWRAFSAFCLTVLVNSSIDEAVSSSAAACCSVRADRSVLPAAISRSEEHTSELQSLMRISYAVFCLKKKTAQHTTQLKR